jgi:2,3-bisphosphoglycerate-independent phosphoglycerate mutase
MSAKEISDQVIEEIKKDAFDVIIMNYANADMVGHTGNVPATIAALESLDSHVGRVVNAVLAAGGSVLLTCDHGNAEEKKNQLTHKRSTDHTINPVPLLYISPDNKLPVPKTDEVLWQAQLTPIGLLADVAPTFLEILGLPAPKEMTAQSLLESLS